MKKPIDLSKISDNAEIIDIVNFNNKYVPVIKISSYRSFAECRMKNLYKIGNITTDIVIICNEKIDKVSNITKKFIYLHELGHVDFNNKKIKNGVFSNYINKDKPNVNVVRMGAGRRQLYTELYCDFYAIKQIGISCNDNYTIYKETDEALDENETLAKQENRYRYRIRDKVIKKEIKLYNDNILNSAFNYIVNKVEESKCDDIRRKKLIKKKIPLHYIYQNKRKEKIKKLTEKYKL